MRFHAFLILGVGTFIVFANKSLAENVLYLGDSHSTMRPLERTFFENFKRKGDLYVAEAVASSAPKHWTANKRATFNQGFLSRDADGKRGATSGPATVPNIDNVVAKFGADGPDIVIIQMGDNMLGDTPSAITGDAKSLLERIFSKTKKDSVACFWIGPTWRPRGSGYPAKTTANTRKVAEAIGAAISAFNGEQHRSCRYIDGMQLLEERWVSDQKGDGLHFADEPSGVWGHKALSVIEEELKKTSSATDSRRAVPTLR